MLPAIDWGFCPILQTVVPPLSFTNCNLLQQLNRKEEERNQRSAGEARERVTANTSYATNIQQATQALQPFPHRPTQCPGVQALSQRKQLLTFVLPQGTQSSPDTFSSFSEQLVPHTVQILVLQWLPSFSHLHSPLLVCVISGCTVCFSLSFEGFVREGVRMFGKTVPFTAKSNICH